VLIPEDVSVKQHKFSCHTNSLFNVQVPQLSMRYDSKSPKILKDINYSHIPADMKSENI
jgi:hypothetical protein